MPYTENQTPRFLRSYKKLSNRELGFLHTAMDQLLKRPTIGVEKHGDLSNLFVHKFKVGKEEWLLGYTFNTTKKIITWEAIGRHENFYRDIKK